eukprot:gene3046-5966_t
MLPTNSNTKFRYRDRMVSKEQLGEKFRTQLIAIPDEVRENARYNFIIEQDIKKKNLQDHQFKMIVKLEKILKKSIKDKGLNYEKYDLGGSRRGVYERFFRIEPSRRMTKAQFILAMQNIFGLDICIGSSSEAVLHKGLEQDIIKLYESFAIDSHEFGGMDWRSFLFLLGIMMKPSKPCNYQLKWAFAVSTSEGALDVEKGSCRLSLSAVKDLICVPLCLTKRPEIRRLLDRCWVELVSIDEEANELADKNELAGKTQDENMLSLRLFNKLVMDTSFAELMVTGEVFGTRDPRLWTCVLETSCYHPILIDRIKILRREL